MRDLYDEVINNIYEDSEFIYYYNDNKKLHRENNLPAIIHKKGKLREYWFNGKRHREDGEAVEGVSGENMWFYQGKHINCNGQGEFEKIIKLKAFWE